MFTFEYRKGETQVIETPGETTTETVVQYIDGGTTTRPTDQTTGQTAGQTAGQTGTQTPEVDTEAGQAQPEEDENVTEVQGEEVPQDLVDLDDEETPLGNMDLDKEDVKKGIPLAAGIAISVAAVAALAGLFIFLRKNRAGRK